MKTALWPAGARYHCAGFQRCEAGFAGTNLERRRIRCFAAGGRRTPTRRTGFGKSSALCSGPRTVQRATGSAEDSLWRGAFVAGEAVIAKIKGCGPISRPDLITRKALTVGPTAEIMRA